MKNKSLRFVCVFFTAVLVILSGIAVNTYAVKISPEDISAQIIGYKLNTEGADNEQELIDGWITENAGTSSAEWYAVSLAKSGSYDFAAYAAELENKINSSGLKATDRQRMALAYIAVGGDNLDIGTVIDETWNKLGIMSEIYALILMNSGEFESAVTDDDIVSSLLERQHEDGGWSLSGNFSDPDVTAMALQALAPYSGNSGVNARIEKALLLISDMQQSDGGYKSYGTANSESCSQVVIALCQLGVDPQSDQRFLKNGNSPVDALLMYQCSSGGFSHLSGGSENGIATVQAYEAFTAMACGGIYDLKKADVGFEILLPDNETEAPVEPEATTVPTVVTTKLSVNSEKTTETTTASGAQKPTDAPQENSGTLSQDAEGEETTETVQPASTEISTNTNEIMQTSTTVTTAELTAETSAVVSSQTDTIESNGITTSITEAAALPSVDDSDGNSGSSGRNGWKIWAYAAVAGIFVFSQIYVIARKQFSWKRTAASAVICAVFAGAVYIMDIQTPEEYYSRNISDVQSDSLTVTMSVSCETIKDELDRDFMIIPETEFVLLEDETAFDLLERVLAYHRIPLDYNGNTATDIYIRGIDNIYEMDYGEMSGWMYRVNGDFPDSGCGACILEDGDTVEWIYTREIGRDIGQEDFVE